MMLAIDTSCDETAVAVVDKRKVLANIIASQAELQKKYGGVYPMEAKRQHEKVIDEVIKKCLSQARVKWKEIQAIGVTIGPGLAPALEVGIRKAKELGQKYNKRVLGINHMEGHLLSCLGLNSQGKGIYESNMIDVNEVEFPVLGLLVSGGHSEIVLVEGIGKYKVIGRTLDDAAGECLDKAARMMGLGYPGGAVIEQFAKKGRNKINLPIPMARSNNLDMSFSGLKTAMLYEIRSKQIGSRKLSKGKEQLVKDLQWGEIALDKQYVYDLCWAIQNAVFRAIEIKLEKAIKTYGPSFVWAGGGVIANRELRQRLRRLCKKYNVKLGLPYSKKLYGDNAAMIGLAAVFKGTKGSFEEIENLERKPRLSL